ncbi:MAG TPA: hypothetical protein VFM49_28295 [Chloroflexia bacterium]|jgi:hypothetical protein|nr:hypothetical protein [Chloroflexia bacterium]
MQANTPDNKVYDRFGKFLMENVRDEAIVRWDMITSGHMQTTTLNHQLLESADEQCLNMLHALIPQIVDSTLFFLLRALDDDRDIAVTIRTHEGTEINLLEVTETLFWELTDWMRKFSRQREYSPLDPS